LLKFASRTQDFIHGMQDNWSSMAYPRLCCFITIGASLLGGVAGKKSYLVILDAGSTGTRAHVFEYKKRMLYVEQLPHVVPQKLSLPKSLGDYKVRPGISSYSTHPEDLEAYITPIIEQAKDKILRHSEKHGYHVKIKHVPLYLSATAGMRMLDDFLRDKVMKALRKYFTSSRCPFHVPHHGQVRVLAGEEEGVFGWLSTNMALGTLGGNAAGTHGALDLGGASAQISFLPEATSILSNMFTMHFGNFSEGPIHIYTHSFLQYGYVTSFQNSAKNLAETSYDSRSFGHPCLPSGVLWNTTAGQYGVSTSGGHIERTKGSTRIKGTGNFFQCRALARGMMYRTRCPVQPCSILSEYQPRLQNSKFLAFGAYAHIFGLLDIPLDPQTPVLEILQQKLESWCKMGMQQQQSAVTGKDIGTLQAKLELSCWMGAWILELLTSGLGFPINTRNIIWGQDIDWTLGQALYEINFFPYVVDAAESMHLTGLLPDHKRPTSKQAVSDSSEFAVASPSLAIQTSMPSFLLTAAFGLAIFAAGFWLGRADRHRASGAHEVRTHLLAR